MLLSPIFIAPYGCRFTELIKQSHVWKRGSYICIQVLSHIICLIFVNYCKLLNTKTAYFSFIKTKIKLLSLFLFPKNEQPLDCYLMLTTASHVLDVICCTKKYRVIQNECTFTFPKFWNPMNLKTSPQKPVNFLLRKWKLLFSFQ